MGESYRGLTITIGADATPLRKSLRAVNSALATTQAQMRKVEQALRFDPSSLDALQGKVGVTVERMGGLAQKLQQLRRAQEEFTRGYSGNLDEDLRDTSARLARANEGFNEANAELERMNRRFAKLAESAGVATEGMTHREVVEALRSQGLIVDETAEAWSRVARAHHEYQAELQAAKGLSAYADSRDEIARTEAELRRLSASLVDAGTGALRGGQGLADWREEAESAKRVASFLEDEMRRLDEALAADPSDRASASRRIENLSEQAEVAQARVRQLKERLDQLGRSGAASDASGRQLAEDAGKAEEAYRKAALRAADMKGELENARQAAMRLETSGESTAGDIARAAARASELEARYEALAREAESARAAMARAADAKEYRELQTAVAAAEARVRSLRLEASQAARAVSLLDRASSSLLSAARGVAGMSAAALYGVVSAAEGIDSAYRDMRKTVDGTEEQFESLRESAIEFSRTSVVSADTTLGIEAMGGQLGIAVEDLEGFAETVSNLDIATDMDAEEIAEAVGQLNNVMHWGEGDIERFGDALVRLGNNMPAQESKIMEITKRVGAAATMYGMSTPEVLAWSTALASTGQNCEAAGTALANTMSEIEGVCANGGEALEGFAEVAGMSASQFAALWERDPSSALRAFVDGLVRLEASGGSADAKLTELGITAVRQKQAIKGLAQTTDVLDDALAMSADAWGGVADEWGDAGDAAREAQRKSEGFSGAMGMLRNACAAAGDAVGQELTPVVEAVTDAVNAAVDAFKSLTPEQRRAALGAAALAAAAVPVSAGALKAVSAVAKLASGLRDAQKAMALARAGSMALRGGLVAVAAVAAVGLLGGAVQSLREAAEQEERLAELSGGLESALRGVAAVDMSGVAGGISGAADATADLVELSRECAEGVLEIYRSAAEGQQEVEQSYAKALAAADVIGALAEKQRLNAVEQEMLAQAVDDYNAATGGTVEVVDAATGSISSNTDELLRNLDAWKRDSEAKSLVSRYGELSAALAEAEARAAELREREAELRDEMSSAGIYATFMGGLRTGTSKELDEVSAALEEAEATVEGLRSSVEYTEDAMDGMAESCGEAAEATGEVADSCDDASDADEEEAALQSVVDSMEELVSSSRGMREAIEASGTTVAGLAQALDEAGFGELAALYDEALQEASRGSVAVAVAMLESIGMTHEQAAETAREAVSGMGDAIVEGADGQDAGQRVASEVSSGIEAASSEVEAAARAMGDRAADALTELGDDLRARASAAAGFMAVGFAEGGESVAEAAGGLLEAVEGELSGLGEAMRASGASGGAALASGLGSRRASASSAGSSLASAALSGMSSFNSRAYLSGGEMGANFASGLRSQLPSIGAAASAAAGAASAYLHHSTPDRGPLRGDDRWGAEMGEGIAAGLLASVRQVSAASEAVARAASIDASAAPGGGLTRADVYEAVSAAVGRLAGGETAVYVDGRKVSAALAARNDVQLGRVERRSRR